SPQTTHARWPPVRLYALSSTHRWRDRVRQHSLIAAIPFSSSLHLRFWDLCYGAPYTRNEKNRSSETPMLPGMILNLCQIANYLTEQCGHETFQISGFWADYGQTGSNLVVPAKSAYRKL